MENSFIDNIYGTCVVEAIFLNLNILEFNCSSSHALSLSDIGRMRCGKMDTKYGVRLKIISFG